MEMETKTEMEMEMEMETGNGGNEAADCPGSLFSFGEGGLVTG